MAAAKAVAARFAWPIRHILTPVFGPDFPNLCIQPHNLQDLPDMRIDPAIIQKCRQEQDNWRANPSVFGQGGASDISARTAGRTGSPAARRAPRANKTREPQRSGQHHPDPRVPRTPLAAHTSLPTPSLAHQSPPDSGRKRKRDKDGRQLPPRAGMHANVHGYPSPRSPEYHSRGATHNPDISPRTTVPERPGAAHYPSPDTPQANATYTALELDAVEGLLKLTHGAEEARRMVDVMRPTLLQHQPANTPSGFGLQHFHDAAIHHSHHNVPTQPVRPVTTSAPPTSQAHSGEHPSYRHHISRTHTTLAPIVCADCSSSDDPQRTISAPRSPEPANRQRHPQLIDPNARQSPSTMEAATHLLQLHEANTEHHSDRAHSARLPPLGTMYVTPPKAGRVRRAKSAAAVQLSVERLRKDKLRYVDNSSEQESDEELDEQVDSVEDEEDDDYEESKPLKKPVRPAKRLRLSSHASGKTRK
jgi:hypothetical protein